jgi:hypothetical protein
VADKSDNVSRVEKGLQPVVRPVTMDQSTGEQAGLQPVVRPTMPTGSGSGSGSGSGQGSGDSGGSGSSGGSDHKSSE